MKTEGDRYQTYLVDHLSRVPTRGGRTAMTKLFSASLISTTTFQHDDDDDALLHVLRSALEELGGTEATLIRY